MEWAVGMWNETYTRNMCLREFWYAVIHVKFEYFVKLKKVLILREA